LNCYTGTQKPMLSKAPFTMFGQNFTANLVKTQFHFHHFDADSKSNRKSVNILRIYNAKQKP